MFIRPEDGEGYYEFNFSPSGEWAAYRFSGYREGMADLPLGGGRAGPDGARSQPLTQSFDVDPTRIEEQGLTLEMLMMAVRQAGRDVGAMSVEQTGVETMIRGVGCEARSYEIALTPAPDEGGKITRIFVVARDVIRIHLPE